MPKAESGSAARQNVWQHFEDLSAAEDNHLPPHLSTHQLLPRQQQLANSTMSRKLSSPAAQLLRNSRLFSLPPPTPGPGSGPGTSAEFASTSETATQPFPTRQAIATPPSSLHRGDWGLKRPLPLRETTRSSAPTMRVYEVDTINLFTDFESAGDHVRTLEKWREMNIPLATKPEERSTGSGRSPPAVSAFHGAIDNTQLTDEMREKGFSKWKYDGPWVAGMGDGKFRSYVERTVRYRKDEFRAHLKKYLFGQAFQDALRIARENGVLEEELPTKETFKLSDEEFVRRLKALREDTTLASVLPRLIVSFFDLPPSFAENLSRSSAAQMLEANGMGGPRDKGPPTTHMSAGLSYLRSSAFLHNHPILGPRDTREPVEARLLTGKQTTQKVQTNVKAGVGGVIAQLDLVNNAKRFNDQFTYIKYEEQDGPKVWVSPERAFIDSNGRIRLSVKTVIPEDVQIKLGSLKSKEEMEAKSAPKIEGLDIRAGEFDESPEATRANGERILEILNEQQRVEGGRVNAPRRGVGQ